MSPTRTWRWTRSDEPGWPASLWTYEWLDTGDERWFARIANAHPSPCPPLVLVHGLVVSGAYFQPVATRLAPDHHIYVPDIPGTGRSLARHGPWSIAEQADRLAEWLELHSVGPAVLVGNSIGCQVLTMLAVRRPDRVAALVLVAPTMDPDGATVPGMMLRGARDIPREAQGLWKTWLTDLARTGPFAGLRHLRQGIADDQVARLDRIGVPVVVVGGERDPIAPVAWVEDLAGAIDGGRAIILPGAPHAINYTNPDRLARIIRVVAGQARDRCRS